MKQRKFKRENARIENMSLAELMKQAARNKRLVQNALAARFRASYAQRKQLGRTYGHEIARRMAK